MGPNEKIVRDMYARYAKQGYESIFDLFDEDIVWRAPGAENRLDQAGEWLGREQAREYFETLRRNWLLKLFVLQQLYSADDSRFAAWLKVEAHSNMSGKRVSAEKVDLVTMKNGKIVRYIEVYDTAPLERASRL